MITRTEPTFVIVGAGGISRSYAQAFVQGLPFQLVGVADIRVESAREVAAMAGVAAYDNVDRMVAELKPSAAIVCTPPSTHPEVCIRLMEQGEERLALIAEELSKNKSVTDVLGKAVKQAAQTKGRLDKNMQNVLGLLNVPSRADYQRLLTKIETLQGSLVNVNMKLDRLLASTTKPAAKRSKRSAGERRARDKH